MAGTLCFYSDKPDPRFEHFTEVAGEDGNVIGFKLDGQDFLYKFDSKGGWHDEDNNYYNSHGVFLYKEGSVLSDADEWDKDKDVDDELID